jgi:hypothetical protein
MVEPPSGEWLITDLEAARLKPAIVDLLLSIPVTWAEVVFDNLTSLQERSLFLLIAAGMVERRGWIRSTMANHPTALEVRFQATGEYGLVSAVEQVASVAYQIWRDAWSVWNEGEKEGRSPFHVHMFKPQEWRLTDQGELARDEVSSADGEADIADIADVVNYVLKRGIYGPGYWHRRAILNQPPSAAEQRIIERELAAGRTLDELPRPSVGGFGRVLETRTPDQPADSAEVNISNWKDGAESFLSVFEPFFEMMTKRGSSANSDEAHTEDAAPPSPTEDVAAPTLTPFQHSDMVFFPDRVTLCGATICSGRRSERQRKVLDLLRLKNADGRFQAYSSKSLAEKVGLKDPGGVPGLIRDLRAQISKRLREQVGIDCGPEDVILSGDEGYRFPANLSVQDGGDSGGGHLQCHTAGVAVENDADRDAVDPDRDADGGADRGADDPDHGADDGAGHDPVAEADGSAAVRQKWILDELSKGRELKAPGIAKELKCSRRTAQRDLNALKAAGKIEHVGPSRTGHYRLTKGD